MFSKLTQVTPTHINADTRAIGAPVHGGAGLSDLTTGGAFTSTTVDHTYVVKITTAGGTDHFEISVDGGAFGSSTAITGSAQTLGNGITITFAATTGHTLNDTWTITATAGVLITANALMNIAQNAVGTASTLYIYNGNGTTQTLVYQSATANWTAGRNDTLGYLLSNGSAYVVMAVTTTAADLIIGTN